MKIYLVLIMMLALPLAVDGKEAKEYTVRLGFTEKLKVGDKFHFKNVVKDVVRRDVSINGESTDLTEKDIKYVLEGHFEVTALMKGNVDKGKFNITQFTKKEKGKEATDILKKRVTLNFFVLPSSKTVSFVKREDKAALTREQSKLFTTYFKFDVFNGSDNEALTKNKKAKIGGKLEVSEKFKNKASAEAKKGGMTIDAKDITAGLKLFKISNFKGVECLQVLGNIKITKMGLNRPGMKVIKSNLSIKNKWFVPVDEKNNNALKRRTDMSMDIEYSMQQKAPGANHAPITVTVALSGTNEELITVKKVK